MFYKFLIILLILLGQSTAESFFVRFSDRGLAQKDLYKTLPASSDNKDIKILPAVPEKLASDKSLKDWYILENVNQDDLVSMQNDNLIIDFEPVGSFKIDFSEQDSIAEKQWYLDAVQARSAWSVSRGNPEIIVAIIDTGIDYEHPDLVHSLWINQAEDLNGNGRLDESDLNGIDDDGNGYIDDVSGWDFTDAPRFSDGGDYLDEDNDPMDEFSSGHGTQIAGIIAGKNLQNGFSGIAPDVKVMNLRAGTAAGYLEEDDVARALLYAYNNGARIINMSFGDIALSRYLNDVIRYIYHKGVICIASAGNSASNQSHYPSSLKETISVSASTQNDAIAGFSNFGNSIDVAAPGIDIFSTAIGGQYNSVSGTSFSAPLVSALAALVLSNNPDFNSENVRNILKTTADDIINFGWDVYSGSGRVNAFRAVSVPYAGQLGIIEPAFESSSNKDQLTITGNISHPEFNTYILDYGIGAEPTSWNVIVESDKQIVSDTIATLNTTLFPDSVVLLRLTMKLNNDLQTEQRSLFYIDRSQARISDFKILKIFDGFSLSRLIQFTTDDVCTARLFIRPKNSSEPYTVINSVYETKKHTFKLDQPDFYGEYEFWIEVTNKSALVSTLKNNFRLRMDQQFDLANFEPLDWSLPAGYMLNKVVDLDQDGNKEIVISRYDQNFAFGPVEIYEFNLGQFQLVYKTSFTAIPRDAGDSDKDGKSELLMGFGQYSFILESADSKSYPTELVWEDSTGFWAAGFTDLDMDGAIEICGRRDQSYFLKENISDNTYQQIAELVNNTGGTNRLAVPRIVQSDFDGDGKQELIYGDSDGDVLFFRSVSDNNFEFVAAKQTIFPDATEMITAFPSGNLFVGTHTYSDINYEHEFDARYWTLERMRFDGADVVSTDSLNLFGYFPTKDYDSGIAARIIDGQQFLLVSFFPRLYLFRVSQDSLIPVWSYSDVRSNTLLVDDFDNDGFDEFYFNSGEKIIGFSSGMQQRPAKPILAEVSPLDTSSLKLQWFGKGDSFNIYRGQNSNQLTLLSNSRSKTFIDSTVNLNNLYYYALTAIDSSLPVIESFSSNLDSVFISRPAKIDSVSVETPNQIIVYLDQPAKIRRDFPVTARFSFAENSLSSALIGSNNSLLLSFTNDFEDNTIDTLIIGNIFNQFDMPLDARTSKIVLVFNQEKIVPYVEQIKWLDNKNLSILFNTSMDGSSLTNKNNYEILPNGTVKEISINDSLNKSIILSLSKQTLTGGTGQYTYIKLKNIKSISGISLADNTTISLVRSVSNLKDVIIYPQPAKIEQHSYVFISGLPEKSEVFIFNLNGNLINKHFNSVELGAFKWDFRDLKKQIVHSGIYIVHIIHKKEKRQFKMMVVR